MSAPANFVLQGAGRNFVGWSRALKLPDIFRQSLEPLCRAQVSDLGGGSSATSATHHCTSSRGAAWTVVGRSGQVLDVLEDKAKEIFRLSRRGLWQKGSAEWLLACGLATGRLGSQPGRDEPPGGPFTGVVCSITHAKFEVLRRHVCIGIH